MVKHEVSMETLRDIDINAAQIRWIIHENCLKMGLW